MGSLDTIETRCKGGNHNSLCNNYSEIYTQINDITTTATIADTYTSEWSAGNKLCLTNGRYPSFARSITNTGFTEVQKQYYGTGISEQTY
ncbi:hypothetical protein DPMN_151067 [Dreissena polymorpha]|uniref:Uncharacterized protein n=1 Tax=Dreissena polymorpha TaxID=45954 RepID=A0A9D4FIU3_DREPO|nr:hypothetical protein DPMN_151067 [Dreissena polymorpha]